MKKLIHYLVAQFTELVSPKPEELGADHQADRIVSILRNHFSPEDQNKILIQCGEKITTLRQEDMIRMSQEYDSLQTETNFLMSKMAIKIS